MTFRECLTKIGKEKGYSDDEINQMILNLGSIDPDSNVPLMFCSLLKRKLPKKEEISLNG